MRKLLNYPFLMDCGAQLKKIFILSFIFIIFILGYTHDRRFQEEQIYSQDLQGNITPLYPYLIEEEKKCAGGAPFLLLLIPSTPQEFHTRNVLRRTWANESLVSGIHIIRLFLLGQSNISIEKVKEESNQFHDIIMQDFIDSYYNLTIKTLMGMEWVSRLCPNVKYVAKIDSDMFFNPWFLVEKILQPQNPPMTNFFTGLIVNYASPHRDKSSKWYLSTKIYPKKFYPPYCSGTGYVFSGDLAKKIYLTSGNLHIFPFEDVFVGMCLENLGVKLFTPTGQWFLGERIPYQRCEFTKLVTVHHFTSKDLLQIWPDFLVAVKTCDKHK